MNGEKLLQCLGEIDLDLIIQADQPVPKRRDKHKKLWKRWGVLAASLALITAVLLPRLSRQETKPPEMLYPYDDDIRLEYVSAPIETLILPNGTLFFHEIGPSEMEAFRTFNTCSDGYQGASYYDTRDSAYRRIAEIDSTDFKSVRLTRATARESAGLVSAESRMEDPRYTAFLDLTGNRNVDALAESLLNQNNLGNILEGQAALAGDNGQSIWGISTRSGNSQISLTAGTDLNLLGEQTVPFLDWMRGKYRSGTLSEIDGVSMAATSFYQTRLFRGETTEERYLYYVYFRDEKEEYLLQFTANWTLPGENVTAMHNPPTTLAYAMPQERCREILIDVLSDLSKLYQ